MKKEKEYSVKHRSEPENSLNMPKCELLSTEMRQTFADLLKKLEKEKIVSRKVIENRPPRVEYSLTDKGEEIADILTKLEKNL